MIENQNNLHRDGEKNRIYYLTQRINQIQQKYLHNIAIRKSISAVAISSSELDKREATRRIREEYIKDKQKEQAHHTMLDEFQKE